MDTISHGLWGGLTFGRRSKRFFIAAIIFGMLPDIIPFGYSFLTSFGEYAAGVAPFEVMPHYLLSLYTVTHSLVISMGTCLIALAWFRRQAMPLFAWPLHLLFDIPSHSLAFFPTPYLWPFATSFFDGTPWVTPWVFIMNWSVLLVLALAFALRRYRKRKRSPHRSG